MGELMHYRVGPVLDKATRPLLWWPSSPVRAKRREVAAGWRAEEGPVKQTTRLRELLRSGKSLVVPGCYNALSARVLAEVGFPALYMTGYGTSLALLGMPDAGLATMTEMHLNARYIAGAVPVPVIADADNGYGNAINVIRTIREYVGTGVAGVHIEDQAIPKRCGHVAGRQVIPIAEAVGKYRAASEARADADPDFVLIARTDARGAHGGSLDEAIRRANAYLEAGADMAFVEGPTSLDEVRRICREVKGPIFYNQTGVSPRLSLPEMQDLGIAIAILPGAALRATVKAVYDLGVALRDRGPLAEAELNASLRGHPLADLHTFAGFDRIRAWEEAYLPPEELGKYEDSVGHQPARS
jgi:2-methylisocitrate lyase-like PEP mutase family enzyme